jgi:hypothetical protein
MGRYGLIEDTSEEDSFDSSLQHSPPPRKRTYPVAFPTERHEEEIYPYNAVPIVVEEEEWKLPLGLTSGAVMECFKSTLGWVGYAVIECGGKLFSAGTNFLLY